MQSLGDFRLTDTVRFLWTSHTADGALVTRTANGTVGIRKDGSTTVTTVGVTDTEDSGTAGFHLCVIDIATAGLAPFADYDVVLTGATIDGVAGVGAVLAHFSIHNRGTDIVARGQLTAASASGFTLASDEAKAGDAIRIISGTGFGFKLIETFDNGTGVGTTRSAFDTTPVVGDYAEIVALPTVEEITEAEFGPELIALIQNGLATAAAVSGVAADVDDLQARTPAALVGGRMSASIDSTGLTAGAAEKNADALLNRNIAGGSNVGRLVKEALRKLRNKVATTGYTGATSTLTTYQEDDVTVSHTEVQAHTAGMNAVTATDPA